MSNVANNLNAALAALNRNDLRQAEELFRRVIAVDKSNVPALNLLVVVLMATQRFAEAEPLIARATSINQSSHVSFYNFGLISKQLNKPRQALENFGKALSLNPNDAETWNARGTVFNDLKEHERALSDFNKAASVNALYEAAHANTGKCLALLGRHDEAIAAYDKALSIKPDFVDAWIGRGNVLATLKRRDGAFAAYDKALAIRPDAVDAWLGRGNVLANLKRNDEAFAAYDKVLSIRPDLEDAWLGRGNVFNELKRHDEALAAYDKALSIRPDLEKAWVGRGHVFTDLRRYDEAWAAYDKAFSFKPDLAEAWLGRGNVLFHLNRHDEALAAYDKAVSVKPDLAEAWFGRGNIFSHLKRYDDAFETFERALSIDPDLDFLYGTYLHAKMKVCDWNGFGDSLSRLEAGIAGQRKITPAFAALGLTAAPELHLLAAKIYADTQHPRSRVLGEIRKLQAKDKIRIGYYSADFHNHATTYLMAGLFELHDKSKFELYGFSFGPGAEDEMRQRVSGAFDEFVDFAAKGSRDIARMSRDLEIDIAVDLKGYTQDSRVGIFAEGCAPIQVAYLGYPGTMGADYIDYVIADRIVVPEENKVHFSEKVVWLPHSYQVNDSTRKISPRIFTRSELGLPEQGFVYCCFNNNFKILPSTFDSWMRILAAVEGSVLWLLEDNATAAGNLRREAASRGIDERRLVFAPRMQLDEHLARHRVADLFIDTLPYNAHTTASDALWAGVPVLTCMGRSFAGRVAASLLNAVGLPELVAHSAEDYEALAIELGRNPERLRQIRQKLDANRLTAPLFDTALFTRHLEAAYEEMHRRCQAGLPPDHIEVPADGRLR